MVCYRSKVSSFIHHHLPLPYHVTPTAYWTQQEERPSECSQSSEKLHSWRQHHQTYKPNLRRTSCNYNETHSKYTNLSTSDSETVIFMVEILVLALVKGPTQWKSSLFMTPATHTNVKHDTMTWCNFVLM